MDEVYDRAAKKAGWGPSKKERASEMKKTDNTCTKCSGKHSTASHGAKSEALKKAKGSGFDSHKRWGNSAIKGHGVNSPAMMEARKKM